VSREKNKDVENKSPRPKYANGPLAIFLNKIKHKTNKKDRELAAMVGASTSNFQQWRSGRGVPSRVTLLHIASVFKVSEDELLAGYVNEEMVKYSLPSITPREQRILDDVREILTSGETKLIELLLKQIEVLIDMVRRRPVASPPTRVPEPVELDVNQFELKTEEE